jgi:hypothetical protein
MHERLTMKSYIIPLLLCYLVFSGCKKESIETLPQNNTAFCVVQQGFFVEYNCDSIVVDDFNGTIDTFTFQIKEFQQSAFTDNEGRKAIRLERWKRQDSTLAWQLKDVWSMVKTNDRFEKVEEDVRMVKLLFPLRENLEWNIHMLNNSESRIVSAKDVNQSLTINGVTFDSTVTVVNTDPENLVSEYRDTEIFAAQIGMVYKKITDVRYVTPPQTGIRSGTIYTMKATRWGFE